MGRPRLETDVVGIFRSARVLAIDEVMHRLSVSRRTAFRRLEEHGYLSSYNHSGRYVTLKEIPRFDSRGLWCRKDARFSRFGTLKATVEHFVTGSRAGMTHEELSELLAVRAQNPLLELVSEGAISRERIGSSFVYLATAEKVRDAQIGIRTESGESGLRPTSRQIIAVLLLLIEEPKASREEVVAGCQRKGVRTTREAVDAIFAEYDLDKKRAP